MAGSMTSHSGQCSWRLDAERHDVADGLRHETVRGNSPATRNTRLAAIHSLFRYANLISRVLAIQTKRTTTTTVTFLNRAELDAVLAAPDQSTWHGRRDHALRWMWCRNQVVQRVSPSTVIAVACIPSRVAIVLEAWCAGWICAISVSTPCS
jgi:hypothetical protein